MSEDQGLGKRLPQLSKTCLASRVRKLGFSAPCTGFVKTDLADFLLFPSLLPITSLLLILVADRVPVSWWLIFNIEVSRATILLKP